MPRPRSNNVRCRHCQRILPGWLPLANGPPGAMRLYHLSQMHLVELTPLLTRMATEDLGTVVMDAFERVKAP